ncbi:MAG: type II secretion system protein, partial [Candidatus Saccharimonadales bacterium]
MHKSLKSSKKGFTIIEVLIVLAIAGLILLIVFLAVPALQRNSRNTQRANDVSRALGAAQEVLNNNNGDMNLLTTAALQTAMGKPSYYIPTNVTVSTTAAPANAANASTVDTIIIYKTAKCAAIVGGSGGQGVVTGTTRQLAAIFTAEGGTTGVPRCQ